MEKTPATTASPADEAPVNAANTPAADAGEGSEDVAPPSSPAREPLFWPAISTAVATAVLGSVALGVWEQVLLPILFQWPTYAERWPWHIRIAATGRIITTHLLLWVPIMAACGLAYALLARRQTDPAPEPVLLTLFVVLAALVVIPAELQLTDHADTLLLIIGILLGLGAAMTVYFVASYIRHRIGPARFQRLFWAAAGLAAIITLTAGVSFIRSPLLNPGAYRVAEGKAQNTEQGRPNVLWIVLDTARADRLSVYGYNALTSPFLEEWAKQSLVFERAMANGVWTMPTHASMFTGLPVRSHGLGHATNLLDDSYRTVADALRESGYATGLFSNNILVGPMTNLSKGFDPPLAVHDFDRAMAFSLQFLCEQWGITPSLPWLDLDYGAALTNHLVARWLDRPGDAPVFVFINYMEAHLPFLCPRRYRAMFMSEEELHRSFDLRRRVYGELKEWISIDAVIDGYDHMPSFDRDVVKRQYEAALRYLDERVREMTDIFRQRGLLANTLVIITSDHGEYLDTHDLWSHHYLSYQDVVHVPLLLRPPGGTNAQRVRALAQLSDLYPTIIRAVLGPDAAKTGQNARDLFEIAARDDQTRVAISECYGAAPPIKPRLLASPDPRIRHLTTGQIAGIDARLKYIWSGDGTRELYDLVRDPGELDNLEPHRWREAQRLEQHLRQWLKAVPAYEPKYGRGDVASDRRTMEALKALGYLADDD